MVRSVAEFCRVAEIEVVEKIEDTMGDVAAPPRPVVPATPTGGVPGGGPGGVVRGIGLLVGSVLALVGLQLLVRNANETAGEFVLRLAQELARDPKDKTDTTTKIKAKEDACQFGDLRDSFGRGAFKIVDLEQEWNKFGDEAVETLEKASDSFRFLSFGELLGAETVAEEWEFQFAALLNCVEIAIRDNIRCSRPPGPRCRVPAIVTKCVLKQSDLTPEELEEFRRMVGEAREVLE